MTNSIAKFADSITLALVAFPVAIMLGTAAHAAPVTVQVSDLNLAAPAGQAAQAKLAAAAPAMTGVTAVR